MHNLFVIYVQTIYKIFLKQVLSSRLEPCNQYNSLMVSPRLKLTQINRKKSSNIKATHAIPEFILQRHHSRRIHMG